MADKDGVDLPDDFDQLLRQELSVKPSPAFAARIRERVAQPQRSPWWRARWIPALGSFATVAAIAWALLVPALTRVTLPPRPPRAPAVRTASVQQPMASPVVEPQRTVSVSRNEPRRSGLHAGGTGLPEIIVDGRQRAALTTLFRMMDQGRVSGDSFAATIPVSIEPIVEQMGAIIVPPVVVSAMPPGGVLQNNYER